MYPSLAHASFRPLLFLEGRYKAIGINVAGFLLDIKPYHVGNTENVGCRSDVGKMLGLKKITNFLIRKM